MTNAVFKRSGSRLTLRCEGHAEYDEYGKDIVCSGISALCQSLAMWCRNQDDVDIIAHIQEPGKFRLTVDGGDTEPWKAVAMGFLGIANRYPDHVSVKISENFFES